MNTTDAIVQYRNAYGEEPALVAQAPGRINIIGEHVDYADGFVLPFAISQRIIVAAAPDDSGQISVYSSSLDAKTHFPVNVDAPVNPPSWENYVRGMVYNLRADGVNLQGAKLWIGGDLVSGSGMSSSAALCVSVGLALAKLGRVEVPRERMAKIAQASEHEFAGTPCGMMDQMAVCFGREGHALLLDCRDLSHEDVPCQPKDVRFLVIPSGVRHALADGAYEKRVHSCRKAIAEISKSHPSVTALRDVSTDMLEAHRDRLDAETYKRSRHVVTELARVTDAVESLKAGDWASVGDLLWRTQDSLRDDYEVSCIEIDELIELLRRHDSVLGARMVGGGFGGIVLAIVQAHRVDELQETILSHYYEPRKLLERSFTVGPSSGAGLCAIA